MAVFTHDEILELVRRKEIIIEPFQEENVGAASVDFHLDCTFRIFKPTHELFHVTSDPDFHKVSEIVEVKDYFTLMPGQAIHGTTKENLTLPPNICAWIQGRSRIARIGLMVHITASFIQPGSSGKQVLEMNNAGPMPLAIHPGVAICQIIFEECKGRALYKGKFQKQLFP